MEEISGQKQKKIPKKPEHKITFPENHENVLTT